MLPEELLRVQIFLSLILAVYVFAGFVLLRWLLSRIGWIKPAKNKVVIWAHRSILSLAFVGILCFAYGYFIEPYWLVVRHVQIKSAKLPPGSESIRVVHISDLHSDPKPRLETKLPEVIREQKPDIVVYSGDSTNSNGGIPVFRECLTEIAKIAPTFVVKGNWDDESSETLFGGTGAVELQGEIKNINIKNMDLSITGVSAYNTVRLDKVLLELPPRNYSIFIEHYPDDIESVAKHNVDLYCAGHTHGGQIALPFYGALITLSRYGKRFEGGTYQVNNTSLNVNRGIGMEGEGAPRVRFWARPEVTVIEIVSQ